MKLAIEKIPDKLFELYASELLRRELYPGLNPISESYDLGEDVRTEQTTQTLHNSHRVAVVASKTPTLTWIRKDCTAVK